MDARTKGPLCQERPEKLNTVDSQSIPAPLLNYKSVSRLLGISERSVFSLVKRGELVAVHVMGSVRFDPRDVQRFIDGAKGVPHDAG